MHSPMIKKSMMMEKADAKPMLKYSHPIRYAKNSHVFVAVPGPPLVPVYIISNVRKASMVLIRIATIIIGFIIGTVNFLNVVHLDKPSTFAASKGALGMDISPANIINIISGIHSHTSITIREKRAVEGLPNHAMCGGNPT